MKLILNCLLYSAQWLHLKMGGTVEMTSKKIILIAPKGRHWFSTDKDFYKEDNTKPKPGE